MGVYRDKIGSGLVANLLIRLSEKNRIKQFKKSRLYFLCNKGRLRGTNQRRIGFFQDENLASHTSRNQKNIWSLEREFREI